MPTKPGGPGPRSGTSFPRRLRSSPRPLRSSRRPPPASRWRALAPRRPARARAHGARSARVTHNMWAAPDPRSRCVRVRESAGPEAVCVNWGRRRGQGGAAEPPGKVRGLGRETAPWEGRAELGRVARRAGEWAPGWGRGGTCPGRRRGGGGPGRRGGWAPGLTGLLPPLDSWLGGGASALSLWSAKDASRE